MAQLQTYYNFLFAGKNKLAEGAPTKDSGILIKDNGTLIPISVTSYTFISAFTLGPSGKYMNKDLQRVTKLILKSFV